MHLSAYHCSNKTLKALTAISLSLYISLLNTFSYHIITPTVQHIGVARRERVHWVHVHLTGLRKFFFFLGGGQIYREVVSAPQAQSALSSLEAEQESNFLRNWEDLDRGRGYLGSFSVCFEGDN